MRGWLSPRGALALRRAGRATSRRCSVRAMIAVSVHREAVAVCVALAMRSEAFAEHPRSRPTEPPPRPRR